MNLTLNILLIIYAVFFVAVALVAMYLGFRYNLHMFQLNGYKNLEHIKRMTSGLGRQWLMLLMIPLGVLRIFMFVPGLEIVILIFLGLTIMQYNFWRKHNTKKKLVFTARVKRLVVVNIILTAALIAHVSPFHRPSDCNARDYKYCKQAYGVVREPLLH